LYKIIHYHRN